MKQITQLAVFFLSTLLSAGTVHAAELKLVASTGVKSVIEELSPAFERATGNKVQLLFQTAVPLKRRIDGGEQFDIVILPPTIVDDLTKEGKVKSTTKGNFAKTEIGAAVERERRRPDISSVEALKKTLVQAKSIAYSKEGLSGTAMAGIIERLGLTKDLAQKTNIGNSCRRNAT